MPEKSTPAACWPALRGTYQLLSQLWSRELDADLLRVLRTNEVRSTFESAGGIVPNADQLDDLAVEYCRLFIGPRDHLPPLQSVWARGELQSEITNSVSQFADILRFQHEADSGIMLDHLGVELNLMGHAAMLAAQDDAAPEVPEVMAEFFRRHLTWTAPFFAALEQRDPHEFYLALARLTDLFLKDELKRTLDD